MRRHRGKIIGRLILTTADQCRGSVILDGGTTIDDDGNQYGALVLRIRRDGFALVVGWRGTATPNPVRRLRRMRHPIRTRMNDRRVVEDYHAFGQEAPR